MDILQKSSGRPLPVQRWTLSFNPLGLLELPAAVGVGIGYRLSDKVEIGSETSLLRNGPLPVGSSLTGIRQIVQLKRFMDKNHHFFLAGEIRYKSFSFLDSNDLINPVTRDTLSGIHYRTHISFVGAAFQFGTRLPLSTNGRFQLEITAGLGIKQKTIGRKGIPVEYQNLYHSIDLNVWDLMYTPGTTIYFPGSIRFVYTFGKKLQ